MKDAIEKARALVAEMDAPQNGASPNPSNGTKKPRASAGRRIFETLVRHIAALDSAAEVVNFHVSYAELSEWSGKTDLVMKKYHVYNADRLLRRFLGLTLFNIVRWGYVIASPDQIRVKRNRKLTIIERAQEDAREYERLARSLRKTLRR